MFTSRFNKAIVILGLIFISISLLACGGGAAVPPTEPPAVQPPLVEAAPSEAAEAAPVEPSPTPEPTATSAPTATPELLPTPTLLPVGMRRSNPYPAGELVSAPNWDVQVLEVKRGEAAWADLVAYFSENPAPPAGKEYLLLKLRVKSTYSDSEAHRIGACDFGVTGDSLRLYSCDTVAAFAPDPRLDVELYTGGEAEGWLVYSIDEGEGNLLLVVQEMNNLAEDRDRFIALEAGAAVGVPPELAEIQPNGLGLERAAPAPSSEKVITEDWEIELLEVVRGAPAWEMVQAVNQFNEPPADGMEYINVRVRARYIGQEDKPQAIVGYYFAATGSANVVYDTLFVVPPQPALSIYLFPGGEFEGWIVKQAAVGETGMLLIFEPTWDWGGNNKRFISLEP